MAEFLSRQMDVMKWKKKPNQIVQLDVWSVVCPILCPSTKQAQCINAFTILNILPTFSVCWTNCFDPSKER
jgi:hypothetical protein